MSVAVSSPQRIQARFIGASVFTRKFIALTLRIIRKLQRRGWGAAALALLQQIVLYEPRLLLTRFLTARLATNLGDDQAAVQAIAPEVVDLLPNVHRYRCLIASIYMQLEDYAQAERYLDLAAEVKPSSSNVWRKYGELNRLRGRIDESVAAFERVASLESSVRRKIGGLQQAATVLGDAGRKECEAYFNRILELDPRNPFAHFGIVDCRRKLDPSDPLFEKIRTLVMDPAINPTMRSHLHYALGNVYDGWGNAPAAFAHWATGNQIRAMHSARFDIRQKKMAANTRCKFFTRERIEELSQHGCPDEFLICVVGMPRSGTTLTEQILGSHSMVRPLGERNDMFRLARNMGALMKDKKAKYPECCSKLTPGQIKQMWQTIQDRMRRSAGPCARVVTKLPEDFVEVGLIKILFPKAKIINARRNVLDVGLSCFRQNFRHIPYSRNIESLAEAFKVYHQMMDHWRSVLPAGSIYELDYEQLVADPETIVPELCGFAGLEYEPSCLDFHTRNQPVKTCSRWQVKQPIYTASVDKSFPYREFLAPLLALPVQSKMPGVPTVPVNLSASKYDVAGDDSMNSACGSNCDCVGEC